MAWFRPSLTFACVSCGKCCKGRTNVFINEAESTAISSYLKLPKYEFFQNFVEERETPDGLLMGLRTKKDKKECIFLKDNRCSIYPVRPTSCRTYPFWPQVTMGNAEWDAEGHGCPGINNITPSGSHIIPAEEVLENLVVHEVHQRGLGPNWTYEDSLDFLKESEQENPDLMKDFETDFFNTHKSVILFEDDDMRVVQSCVPMDRAVTSASSTTAATAATITATTFGGGNSSIEADVDNNDSDSQLLYTTRRLEFKDSINLIQTEVPVDSATGIVQHCSLTINIHRMMADSILLHLNSQQQQQQQQQQRLQHNGKISMLVIGAGGCALPMHLSQKISQPALISVVDLNKKVLTVAEQYFGALFLSNIRTDVPHIDPEKDSTINDNNSSSSSTLKNNNGTGQGLFPYHMDGKVYCQQALALNGEESLDVIVVDACQTIVPPGTSTRIAQAPPSSMLDPLFLQQMLSLLSTQRQGGLLLINVWGNADWARKTQEALSTAMKVDQSLHNHISYNEAALIRLADDDESIGVITISGDSVEERDNSVTDNIVEQNVQSDEVVDSFENSNYLLLVNRHQISCENAKKSFDELLVSALQSVSS